MAPSVYTSRFRDMQACPSTYFVISVVERATDRVVAAGTLFVERKFIRGGGNCGHIEDIVVAQEMQGRKLGVKLISALEAIANGQGCYKAILDCSPEKTGSSSIVPRSHD